MPLLARIFLVQTFIISVFIPEKIKKTKAIGKDSSSRKEKKKGKICWKIKVFGKDRSNLAKGLWSRSLLRQKRRPWSSFPMTQGLQNYYIVCFFSDSSNCERIKEIAPKRINQICWNIISYSHSANSDIVGCIWGDFAGKTFANMLIFHLLFSAVKFISIKIVSQKAGKYNRIMWSST